MSRFSPTLRRLLLLGWAATSTACVIRYGEGTPPAPDAAQVTVVRPVDVRPIERQIAELVDKTEDVDSRDRLELAWALAENVREADPAAQHIVRAYLESVIEVETRARPVVTPLQTRALGEGFAGAAAVESAELAGPEPIKEVKQEPEVDLLDPMAMEAEPDGEGEAVATPAEEEGPDADALLAEAARHLKAHKPKLAMEALDACRGLPCWEAVGPSWAAARDAHVFAEKEALAVQFLELRGEAETEVQRAGLLKIQGELSSLRAAWPDSGHADEIEDHMTRVQTRVSDSAVPHQAANAVDCGVEEAVVGEGPRGSVELVSRCTRTTGSTNAVAAAARLAVARMS